MRALFCAARLQLIITTHKNGSRTRLDQHSSDEAPENIKQAVMKRRTTIKHPAATTMATEKHKNNLSSAPPGSDATPAEGDDEGAALGERRTVGALIGPIGPF